MAFADPVSPLPLPSPDEPPRLTARTLGGLERVLAAELEAVGASDLTIGRRTVEFSGTTETLYRGVLECRTAIRVLEPLGRFAVTSEDALYQAVASIDWGEQLTSGNTLRIDAVVHDTFLNHSLYAAQLVKDAIVDRLRDQGGWRPNVQLRGATHRYALHLAGSTATLFRDCSGRSLHQRGWRPSTGEAPLSEVLGAGILAIAGWPSTAAISTAFPQALVDPMCGSGTFVIEAAQAAAGIAPGLARARRGDHGFLRFRDCDRGLASRLVADLEQRIRQPACVLQGSDLDPSMKGVAEANARRAGVADWVTFSTQAFDRVTPPADSGLVVTNPPYGERLPTAREGVIFRRLADWLFARFGGWQAAVLAPDTPAAKQFGLKPRLRMPLKNGPIDCRLLVADIRRRERPVLETVAADAADTEETVKVAVGPGRGGRTVDDQIGDFRRRLAKRFRHLSKWARRQGIEAFRLYDRDIPEIPLAIDWYAGWLHAAEYDRPHERTEIEHDVWLAQIMDAASAELGVPPAQAFLKMRRRQRHGGQYEKFDERGTTLNVREGDITFEVNLSDYLDTGLFLDHRTTRKLVADEARGRRFLNLFCYTGSFTVAAAAAGASETVSVDLSNTYLDWTRRNLHLNRCDNHTRHRLARSEARRFLADWRGPQFELAVVDPPTFSRSAKSPLPWDVQEDHAALLGELAERMVPGGVVYFSNNSRRFRLHDDLLASHYTIREITKRTVPEDFRNQRIHHCWRLVRHET
ncbi:MAG: bifunctional 23S rRNA (guanine(2069)-N(7))-methyltransferase RlmK/23S rRNA (guanine(2445)-N(2))-methyltransferase RlmL [Pirellulales bacterium]|jgi:23S rRNA (guanine2445-N2)-methyltransferase / 23S rRNA (guanine2069-N7)-methyltransferase